MAKKQALVYDPNTKKMITAPKKAAGEKEGRYKVSITEAQAKALLDFGDTDGVDRSADTETGKKVRATAVVRMYAQQAVNDFIAARNAASIEES